MPLWCPSTGGWVLGSGCWGWASLGPGAERWWLGVGAGPLGAGGCALWALGAGRWALVAGRWARGWMRLGLGAGRWCAGRWWLGAGRWCLGAGRKGWALGAGDWALGWGNRLDPWVLSAERRTGVGGWRPEAGLGSAWLHCCLDLLRYWSWRLGARRWSWRMLRQKIEAGGELRGGAGPEEIHEGRFTGAS